MRRVTQLDLAKALGVSPSTVGLVVGNTNSPLRKHLNKETIRRIEEKAREMGYRPNRAARVMRQGRTNLIAFLHMSSLSELVDHQAYHIGRMSHELGYDYQTVDAFWWVGEGARVIDQLASLNPEGLIIGGSLQVEIDFNVLRRLGIAMVSMNTNIPKVAHVRHEVSAMFRELTLAAYANGKRKPVLILYREKHGEPTWQMQHRKEGFLNALKTVGKSAPIEIQADSSFDFKSLKGAAIFHCDPPADLFQPFIPGMQAAERIATDADALICANDKVATGALTHYVRHGVSVPQQVAISGFDDIPTTTQGSVYLTSVTHPTEAMCEKAMGLLVKQIKEKTPLYDEVVYSGEIIWRESLPLVKKRTRRTRSVPIS